MKIHYICRGNVYRSRMAEAYTRHLVGDRRSVSSSGIQAELALNGEVDPVAVEELRKDKIESLLAPTWRQTTQAMIDDADIVVILSESLLESMRGKYELSPDKIVVWNIPDIDGVYGKIKEEIDGLVEQRGL